MGLTPQVQALSLHVSGFIATSITPEQCPGRFLDIIGGDPSVSKSNRSHVDNFQFFFIKWGCFPINSSKLMGDFTEVLNFNWLSLKLHQFVCDYSWFSPFIDLQFSTATE